MPIIVSRGAASIKSLGFAGAGKPLAPTIETASRTSASISVPFTAGYNGGAPITGYTITSTPGNYTFTGASSPIAATGMTLGTNYTFTVRATNVYGDSPESASSNSLKYASVPLAPTIGTATVTGTTSVNVSFTAPVSDGGEPITQYAAVAFIGGVPIASGTLFQSGSGTISVTNLTSGASYTFKVLAYNAIGAGVYSAASNSATPDLPTYNITNDLVSNTSDEGVTASIYVDSNETVTATTLYWSVSGTGITVGDFDSGSITGSVSITPTVRSTVTLGIKADGATEGSETFTLSFYTNSGRTTLLTGLGIGGYVIGNSQSVSINDTSTVSYSVSPNTTSVNEGSSVSFTVGRTDGASSTAYWNIQSISGTVNSSDLSTSGSVSIASGSGSFSISITADQTLEGSESFRVRLYTDSGRTALVATSSTITINDTSQYVPAGTYQGSFCSGYNLYYIYADGSGGTYNSLIQSNSPTCGYVAPTLAPSVSLNFNYTIFGPNSQTKAYYIYISKGNEPVTQTWSVSGLAVQSGFGQGAAGIFTGTTSTAIAGFLGPHSATTVTVTVAASGYTSYVQDFSVSANSLYSPYTFSLGWSQEFSRTGSALTLAQNIAVLYTSNSAYTTTNGLIPPTRYGLYRRPDAGGLNYWTGVAITNGWSASSQDLINAFFSSSEASATQPTIFQYGTGYNTFSDRP